MPNDSAKEILNEILGLDEERRVEDEEITFPKTVRIGRGAMEKAYAICDAVKEARGSIEWYGLLVSRKEEPVIVRDVAIGNQRSTSGHTEIDGEELAVLAGSIRREFGDEFTVTGWIHSHGSLPAFFSDTDQTNMLNVLNSVRLNTQGRFMQAYRFIEGKKTVSLDRDHGEIVLRGGLATDPEARISGAGGDGRISELLPRLYVRQPVMVGWSHSVVVNDSRESKGSVSVHKEYLLSEKAETWSQDADIEVVEGKDYEIKVDRDALRKEVKKKVKGQQIIRTLLGSKEESEAYWWEQLGIHRPAIPGFENLSQFGYSPPLKEREAVSGAEFLEEAVMYEAVHGSRFRREVSALRRIIARAIEEGSKYAEQEAVAKTEVRNPVSIITMIAPDATIRALDDYAKANPPFAGFMSEFVSSYARRQVIHRYASEEGFL
ncbi:MAG: hypothetical protein HYW25_03780 [Candidatus Aenigmarchaeota archaeon]|nr:hypothetical protein [Candidatus Aenigmarchaeota archaeon]